MIVAIGDDTNLHVSILNFGRSGSVMRWINSKGTQPVILCYGATVADANSSRAFAA